MEVSPRPMKLIVVGSVSLLFGALLVAVAPAGDIDVVDAHWTQQAPLPEVRTEVSVANDGERIFLAGGFAPPGTGEAAPRTVWAYSPDEDEWHELTSLPEGVNHAAMAYFGGRLFVLGGFREATFEPVGKVRIFDLADGSWSDGAEMPTPRGAAAFTVLDDRIHIIGGNVPSAEAVANRPDIAITQDRSVNVHEAYDPEADSWTELAPMPTPRNHVGAAAWNGKIHVVLGRADGDFTMRVHEVYDAATDTWEEAAPVPTGRSGVAVVAHDGYIYAFGGETFGEARTFDDAERYDIAGGRWEVLPPMPTPRHGLGAAPHQGSIYVISGGPEPGFSFGDMNERLDLGP